MSTFRSIEELVKSLDREKELLKEMFAKRKSLSFRYDYALEMTEYKEERIRYLIDYGVIRDTGDFLEMEDIYLKFFEDVLEVNEEINVSFVQDYLTRLNENIDYYLKENNEQRKYNYQREVKRCLKNIALTTVRNVMDLKRNMDNTYKNEPNYKIKKTKLVRLDEKRNNIALLIRKSEELIDYGQPVFFRVAMDVQMRNVVSDVKLQLNDSYHNLIEIQKQIIHYLNLIDYQNRIFEKVKKLKYLKDQFLMIRDGDGKDRRKLISQLCNYYEEAGKRDVDHLPKVRPQNVLVLKYYSFENYFFNPKIMAQLGVVESENAFYQIFYEKWQEYLSRLSSGQKLISVIGHDLTGPEDVKAHMEEIRIYMRGHNMFDCFYGRFKKEENELLSRYVALAPREEFADILDAIDRFVYFESRKV